MTNAVRHGRRYNQNILDSSPASQRVRFPGATTDFIPERLATDPELKAMRVEALLADLAAAIRGGWELLSVGIHVEASPAVESAQLDASRLRGALVSLMKEFLEIVRARPDGLEPDALIVLRGRADPAHGGMLMEVICIGLSIPQNSVREAAKRGAFRAAEEAVAAHGGALELLPATEEDVLFRMRLPLAGNAEAATVIRKPG